MSEDNFKSADRYFEIVCNKLNEFGIEHRSFSKINHTLGTVKKDNYQYNLCVRVNDVLGSIEVCAILRLNISANNRIKFAIALNELNRKEHIGSFKRGIQGDKISFSITNRYIHNRFGEPTVEKMIKDVMNTVDKYYNRLEQLNNGGLSTMEFINSLYLGEDYE